MRTRDEAKESTIRNAAIEMIANEGIDNFGMNKLARVSKVSPATLYIYYKDKDDLIHQLVREVSAHLLEYSFKNFSPEMSFKDGLKTQWINRAEYFLKLPLEHKFIEHLRYTHYYDEVQPHLVKKFKDILGPFIKRAVKEKELLELPFEVYWSVAFAPLYQLIKFHSQGKSHANRPFKLKDSDLMLALDLVLKALRP
ncbi:MAG TPA: TetR/AcrR family transcriptional regulator [Cytophagaceae bacterium]|jgi:AcrR family transcriptional regulator